MTTGPARLPGDMRHKAMVGGGSLAFFESVSIEGIEGLRGDQFMGPWDLRRMPGCPLTSLYDVLFLEFWWRALHQNSRKSTS